MSSYSDISGMENLREASNSIRGTDFKTYVEGKAHEAQNDAADVITGLGNELMGHASIKTLEHIGKAKKAVNKATKDFADRASKALGDARDGVRAKINDVVSPVKERIGTQAEEFGGSERTSNPFGGARVEVNEDGTARLAVSTEEPAPAEDISQPKGVGASQAPKDDTPQPAPPEPEPAEGGGVGSDTMKGAEQVAKQGVEKEGEDLAEKGGEQVLKKGLKGAFFESLGEDESPIGLGATAVLGVATLLAGIFSHHHSAPPVATQHYTQTQPINYSYQAGLS